MLRGGLKLVLEESGTEIAGDYATTEEIPPRDPGGVPLVVYLLMHAADGRGIREEIEILRRADSNSRITVMLPRLAADDLVWWRSSRPAAMVSFLRTSALRRFTIRSGSLLWVRRCFLASSQPCSARRTGPSKFSRQAL